MVDIARLGDCYSLSVARERNRMPKKASWPGARRGKPSGSETQKRSWCLGDAPSLDPSSTWGQRSGGAPR